MRSRLKPRCEPNIPELTSQEKLDGLKSKILDGQFTTHIKASHVPIISPNEVFEALVKTNRQAANAIDGWTKDMLLQVIDIDREIAVYLGVLLHWALTTQSPPSAAMYLSSHAASRYQNLMVASVRSQSPPSY
jgi:hypothetical protein